MTDIVSMTDERAMKRDVAGRIGLAVVTLLATVAAGPLAGQGVSELRIERAEGAVDVRTLDLEMGFAAVRLTLFEESSLAQPWCCCVRAPRRRVRDATRVRGSWWSMPGTAGVIQELSA